MSKEIAPQPSSYIPSARSAPPGSRRRFSAADKRRIVDKAERPGASVSSVARQYGITTRLLFRWRQELVPPTKAAATFLPVTITDAVDRPAAVPSSLPAAPVIIERSAPGIEVELIGGRRVRFDRDTDPEIVRRLVTLLEEEPR